MYWIKQKLEIQYQGLKEKSHLSMKKKNLRKSIKSINLSGSLSCDDSGASISNFKFT